MSWLLDLRVSAALVAVCLLLAGSAVAGYLLGRDPGADLESARAAGESTGAALGRATGRQRGYAVGFDRGRDHGFATAYERTYRSAFRRSFSYVGLRPPALERVRVPPRP